MAVDVRIFLPCAPGLEEALAREVVAIGAVGHDRVPGGVEAWGDRDLVYRANLEVGLAKSVLLRVATFTARRFDRLVARVRELPWPNLIAGAARIDVTSKRSRLYHTGAIAERITQGIEASLERPIAGDDPTEVHVRFSSDRCTISIDTSGEPLTRRGYRRATGKAPLSPDLARALILAADWDPATPLVDPFSGSGTIPIEAALLGNHIPPGANRSFAFEHAPWFERDAFDRLRDAALARATKNPLEIHGSDRDAGVVVGAAENATRAGVDVTFVHAAVSDAPGLRLDAARAAVVTNPPYGHRVAKGHDLRPLFQRFGAMVREHPEWTVALLATDRRLASAAQLDLETRGRWRHGGKSVDVMIRTPAR